MNVRKLRRRQRMTLAQLTEPSMKRMRAKAIVEDMPEIAFILDLELASRAPQPKSMEMFDDDDYGARLADEPFEQWLRRAKGEFLQQALF